MGWGGVGLGGGSWWWWEGWGLYSRNKEFLSENNGLKQTLHGHGLFDGMLLVWCLHAFICCLRCLGELQTLRTCGCYVKPELHVFFFYYFVWGFFFFSLFETGNSKHDPERIKKEQMKKSAKEGWNIHAGFFFFFLYLRFFFPLSHQLKCWNLIRSEAMTNQCFTVPVVRQPNTPKGLSFHLYVCMSLCSVKNATNKSHVLLYVIVAGAGINKLTPVAFS